MAMLTKAYIYVRESLHGQTMTEYVLILSAVALAAMVAYKLLGTTISTFIGTVNSQI